MEYNEVTRLQNKPRQFCRGLEILNPAIPFFLISCRAGEGDGRVEAVAVAAGGRGTKSGMERLKVVIHGAVQGVGFRPFVYRLASESGLRGWVLSTYH